MSTKQFVVPSLKMARAVVITLLDSLEWFCMEAQPSGEYYIEVREKDQHFFDGMLKQVDE